MDIDRITSLWPKNTRDKNATIALWDAAAPDYGRKPKPTTQSSAVLSLIERTGMLPKDSSALDIGCGSGRYTQALACMCAHVTATDISPKMLYAARRIGIPNADFVLADWDDADIDALGWGGRFDLALANMTPAVDTPDALSKMCAASRGWCLLVRPTHRTDSVTDKITAHLGIADVGSHNVDTMPLCFALLWQMGYLPHIEYGHRTWDVRKPLDSAIQMYTDRIRIHHSISQTDEHRIGDYLESIAEDGFIHEHVETTVVMLYWQV